MANAYKVVGRRPVLGIEPGAEGELELSAQEEHDHLAAGRLQIVPRAYRVIGPRKILGHENDTVFLAAMTVEQEATLVEAGHIERAPMTEARKKEAAKELKAEVKKEPAASS